MNKILKNIIFKILFFKISLFILFSLFTVSYSQTKRSIELTPLPKGQLRYCFNYKNKLYTFLDSGSVYEKSSQTHIAKVKNGCFIVAQKQCPQWNKLVFQLSKLNRYKQSIEFAIPKNSRGCKFTHRDKTQIRLSRSQFELLRDLAIAIPYVENVSTKNSELLKQITPFISSCKTQYSSKSSQISCQVYQTYRFVVDRYRYIKDPYSPFSKQDAIYSPKQTIRRGGGDCEDLSALLLSYLANQGINSYMLLTDDHAYGMACGIDRKTLEKIIFQSFETNSTDRKTLSLATGQINTLTQKASSRFNTTMKLNITSSKKIDIYTLNENEYNKLIKNRSFRFYKECSKENTTQLRAQCTVPIDTFVVIQNLSSPRAQVKIEKIHYYNQLNLQKQKSIRYYQIKNNYYCVVLEPTVGKNGYPGFSVDNSKKKQAINPVNWKWFYIQ